MHTPGPWAWTHIGEKVNGYVVGVACDINGKELSGYIEDRDDLVDEIIYKHEVGELEASTVNYEDASLIAAAPMLLEALKDCSKQLAQCLGPDTEAGIKAIKAIAAAEGR